MHPCQLPSQSEDQIPKFLNTYSSDPCIYSLDWCLTRHPYIYIYIHIPRPVYYISYISLAFMPYVQPATTDFYLRSRRYELLPTAKSFKTPSIHAFSPTSSLPSTLACHLPFAPPPLTRPPLKRSACLIRDPKSVTREGGPERRREEVELDWKPPTKSQNTMDWTCKIGERKESKKRKKEGRDNVVRWWVSSKNEQEQS